jgi:hypothetical protein
MHQVESTKIPHLVLIVVVFITVMILLTSTLPSAFAHGGHQTLTLVLVTQTLKSTVIPEIEEI